MEIETVAYGYIPMMLSEYCPMGVVARSCKKDKRAYQRLCGFRKETRKSDMDGYFE